jgi:hypothetical protein
MKYAAASLTLASLAALAAAQNETTSAMMPDSTGMAGGNNSFTAGLVAALQGANLTTLATVLQGYPDLAASLEMGNFTVSYCLPLRPFPC